MKPFLPYAAFLLVMSVAFVAMLALAQSFAADRPHIEWYYGPILHNTPRRVELGLRDDGVVVWRDIRWKVQPLEWETNSPAEVVLPTVTNALRPVILESPKQP